MNQVKVEIEHLKVNNIDINKVVHSKSITMRNIENNELKEIVGGNGILRLLPVPGTENLLLIGLEYMYEISRPGLGRYNEPGMPGYDGADKAP